MRRRGRVDGSQEAIVKALRAAGCSVQSLAACGGGVPDLLVGTRDRNVLLEVKDAAQPANKRKLRASQVAWHAAWRGTVHIVTTPLEALEAVLGRIGMPTRSPSDPTRPERGNDGAAWDRDGRVGAHVPPKPDRRYGQLHVKKAKP